MIFVTVGTQLPFDRLIITVLNWCNENGVDYIMQVGDSSVDIDDDKVFSYLSPNKFKSAFESSDLVISHAGMGTILSCAQKKKPLLILARDFGLAEHRNDHQKATVEALEDRLEGIICYSEGEVIDRLEQQSFMFPVFDGLANKYFGERMSAEIIK